MTDGHSKSFRRDFGMYRTVDIAIPEYCIAYDEDFVIELYHKYGLTIWSPIRYGLWCGREDFTSYQDIIVALNE